MSLSCYEVLHYFFAVKYRETYHRRTKNPLALKLASVEAACVEAACVEAIMVEAAPIFR